MEYNIPKQKVIDILDREHDYLDGMIGELGGTISRIKQSVNEIPPVPDNGSNEILNHYKKLGYYYNGKDV